MKKKRAKAKTRPHKDQNTKDDQAALGQSGQESSDRPTNEELLEWAATQRRLHRQGKLLDAYAKALEAIPGWTWDEDAK